MDNTDKSLARIAQKKDSKKLVVKNEKKNGLTTDITDNKNQEIFLKTLCQYNQLLE